MVDILCAGGVRRQRDLVDHASLDYRPQVVADMVADHAPRRAETHWLGVPSSLHRSLAGRNHDGSFGKYSSCRAQETPARAASL